MSPPAKKVIDRMLKKINDKIKRGVYSGTTTSIVAENVKARK